MKLADNINNAIRSDRPESPTDLIFIYLGAILGFLWIYRTISPGEITAIIVIVGFMSSLKMIKVGSDFQKKRKAACDGPETNSTTGNQPG